MEKYQNKEFAEINIQQCKYDPTGWIVEAIDFDGSIEKAVFYGNNADSRSKIYATHQYMM